MTTDELRKNLAYLLNKYVSDNPKRRDDLLGKVMKMDPPPAKAVLNEIVQRDVKLDKEDEALYSEICYECI